MFINKILSKFRIFAFLALSGYLMLFFVSAASAGDRDNQFSSRRRGGWWNYWNNWDYWRASERPKYRPHYRNPTPAPQPTLHNALEATPTYEIPAATPTHGITEPTSTPFYPFYTQTPQETYTPHPTNTATHVPPTAYPTNTPTHVPPTEYPTSTPTHVPPTPVQETPEPTPTQVQSTPTPIKEPCVLRIFRRGKGYGSRWNSEPSPFSNFTLVSNVQLIVNGKEVIMWHLDPCNRVYGGCNYGRFDVTKEYLYNGHNYTIIGPGNVLGGECSLIVEALVSPLVIDFKMDGVQFTSLPSAKFDFGGGKSPTYWIANGNDVGFLAFDKNGNRRIDNINELFGDKTKNDEGKKPYLTGFEALAVLDSNRNGEIDPRDKDFDMLRIWFDKNSNGKTDAGELKRLRAMDIMAISLDYENIIEFEDGKGNSSRQRSMVFLEGNPPSGVGIYDVYFARSASSQAKPKKGSRK